MEIKLNYIHLQNFKGIKDFKLIINGRNANVYGDNNRYKTTLKDGWNWVLFDKNSQNVADTNFKIKPQDSQGRDINHLQTVVEAELLIDGQPLKLKKLREEKWVTRHGTTEPVMDGHTKLYWFNEVPVKAKEYQAKVSELISENIFKMITDPLYFNTKIDWEERRKTLLKISGDATDEQVIASDESLSALAGILRGRSIDDFKLVIADQLRDYKKERNNLPPRIDELTMSLPQEEPNYIEVEVELKKHKEDLSTVEFLLTSAANKSNKIAEKYKELSKLKYQLEETKDKIKSELNSGRKDLIDKKQELENGKIILQSGISSLQMDIVNAKTKLENNAKTRQRLLDEWRALSDKNLEISSEEMEPANIAARCPVCEQIIPEETIAKEFEMYVARFGKSKTDRLMENIALIEQNKASGLALKEDTEKTQSTLAELEKELSDKEFQLENLQISINAISEALSKPTQEPDYKPYPEIVELSTKIDNLAYELDKPVEDNSAELLQRKSDIQIKIDELNKVLNLKEKTERDKARIKELETEEKRLSIKIAELEGHKFLLERFEIVKANFLEDKINSQFKHVKFKLFEDNITNEGGKPTCIALVNTNGSYVPFPDANDAGKINAGIDCLNSLSKFYGVTAPLWVDNRESVTKLADTDSQVISLIVSEPDKELRVKVL